MIQDSLQLIRFIKFFISRVARHVNKEHRLTGKLPQQPRQLKSRLGLRTSLTWTEYKFEMNNNHQNDTKSSGFLEAPGSEENVDTSKVERDDRILRAGSKHKDDRHGKMSSKISREKRLPRRLSNRFERSLDGEHATDARQLSGDGQLEVNDQESERPEIEDHELSTLSPTQNENKDGVDMLDKNVFSDPADQPLSKQDVGHSSTIFVVTTEKPGSHNEPETESPAKNDDDPHIEFLAQEGAETPAPPETDVVGDPQPEPPTSSPSSVSDTKDIQSVESEPEVALEQEPDPSSSESMIPTAEPENDDSEVNKVTVSNGSDDGTTEPPATLPTTQPSSVAPIDSNNHEINDNSEAPGSSGADGNSDRAPADEENRDVTEPSSTLSPRDEADHGEGTAAALPTNLKTTAESTVSPTVVTELSAGEVNPEGVLQANTVGLKEDEETPASPTSGLSFSPDATPLPFEHVVAENGERTAPGGSEEVELQSPSTVHPAVPCPSQASIVTNPDTPSEF